MKTDPFDDAIRRKLEEVNPPFQEKNWFQFQRFMGGQGFPPSLWQTPARWLQPALTAAAITGLVISTIWQYRTTQSLTDHVQTLTKTVERMERVQLRLQQTLTAQTSTPARVDTVYLTTSTPTGSLATREITGRPNPVDVDSPGFTLSRQETSEPGLKPDKGIAPVASASPVRAGQQRWEQDVDSRKFTSADQLAAGQTTADGNRQTGQFRPATDQLAAGQSQPARDQAVADSPGSTVNSVAGDKSRYAAELAGAAALPPESGRASTRRTGRSGTLPSGNQSTDYQSTNATTRLPTANDPTLYAPSVTNQATANAAPATSPALTASGPLATVQPLTPLALSTQNEALAESWQRHLRRVRYRSPYATSMGTVAAAEPASPARHTTPLPVRFRLGVGGDIGTAQRGPGVYAEAIWANRWTISTGINQFDWVGDEYSTEKQFTAKTKRDFRRDYPGSGQQAPIGPGRPDEVLNISRTAQSIVVSVQVGYRFAVAKQYVLTPSVGINLSLNPRETAAYSHDRPMFGGQIQETITVERPLGWYSSLTAGVSAERQWGHFVAQLTPGCPAPHPRVDRLFEYAVCWLAGPVVLPVLSR